VRLVLNGVGGEVDDDEVGLPGIMHVEAVLLDAVGDVRAGECQVLEVSSKALELIQIYNRRLRLNGDLGLHVHGCRN
jgi:hypothetical protein